MVHHTFDNPTDAVLFVQLNFSSAAAEGDSLFYEMKFGQPLSINIQ